MEIRVLNYDPMHDYRSACKITEGKTADNDWTPEDPVNYWIKQIIANHSTLRFIHFVIKDEAPKSCIMQIIRATKGHPQPEVQSSRPDWTGKERSLDPYELKQYSMCHTAESFVEMMKQRLCNRTEKRTRDYCFELVHILQESPNPFLKAVGLCCMPSCYHNGGYCPEIKSCGLFPSKAEQIIKGYKESTIKE